MEEREIPPLIRSSDELNRTKNAHWVGGYVDNSTAVDHMYRPRMFTTCSNNAESAVYTAASLGLSNEA